MPGCVCGIWVKVSPRRAEVASSICAVAPYCAMLLAVHGAEVVKLKPDAALPPAPRIGEHGAAILAEIGVDAATIASLCTENIVLIPEVP
jgi:crotonobetainyl-CoA:carnitine CoA-transferase CaiB-like acyl-CoA transferase